MRSYSRREFLKIAGAMGGATLFAGCSLFGTDSPVPKFIKGAPGMDPVETTVGVETVFTTCGLCPGNCSIGCRVAQGALVKIGGSPYGLASNAGRVGDSSTGNGSADNRSICAVGGSGIQTLYDPFRVARPLKRVGERGSGKWSAISWEQALTEILSGGYLFGKGNIEGLARIHSQEGGIHFLLGQVDWGSLLFIRRFANAFGTAEVLRDSSIQPNLVINAAAQNVFGPLTGPIAPDYDHLSSLVSFGDAPLDSGIPLVGIARILSDRRIESPSIKWAVVDPRLSTSASKSDLWVPLIPGRDRELAFGIMRSLLDRYSDKIESPNERFKIEALSQTVSQWANAAGLTERIPDLLADTLVTAGKSACAFPGRGILRQASAEETSSIILSLNKMVGSVPGSGGLIAENHSWVSEAEQKLVGREKNRFRSDQPKALIIWNSDPVYSRPSQSDLLKDQSHIPLLVSIDTHITETSVYSDYILPDTTYLERWDVCIPPRLTANKTGLTVRQPVVGAIDSTSGKYYPILSDVRLMEDILSEIGSGLELPGFHSEPLQRPSQFYSKALSVALESMKTTGVKFGKNDDNPEEAFKRGGIFGSWSPIVIAGSSEPSVSVQIFGSKAKAADNEIPSSVENEFQVIAFTLPFHPGSVSGLNSWLLEILPENFPGISVADAAKMNVGRNDQVTLTSSDGKYKIKTRIQILPGVRPGTVTIARGFGYRQAGAAAQIIDAASTVDRTRGAGINPYLFESGIVKISKA